MILTESVVKRCLDVIEKDILPQTKQAVTEGHNIFGGAVLLAKDLSLVTAGTNRRGLNPLWHGEIVTIGNFYAMTDRPDPKDTAFLCTHEPCSMCLSALAWCGFPKVLYLFGYEETRDDFAMAGDLDILAEVFATTVPTRENRYFRMQSLQEAASGFDNPRPWFDRIEAIRDAYKALVPLVLSSDSLHN
ncbi:MAG: nucleoside deaminase [Thermovirgaceae bacterium]